MRLAIPFLLLASLSAGLCLADGPDRRIPERCVEIVDDSAALETDSSWNEFYREGLQAIQDGDHHFAEQEMCLALFAAREFEARDWRFAETLDELGLIAFTLRDFELAEQMQGAAIAEMLLAVGPHGEPFRDRAASDQAPIRPDCRSGVRAYTERLGWIHQEISGRVELSDLERAPWRIFAAGYLALDEALAQRLDWLISQYLLEESSAAADELSGLRRRILAGEEF